MTKIAFFSTKHYDQEFFNSAIANSNLDYKLVYHNYELNIDTACLAKNADVVCVFVNDKLNKDVISQLVSMGVKLIALRCAGFNNIDLQAAKANKLPIVRVPAYSPYAVAEHAMGLILNLNRKIHKAYIKTRENNFSLDGLLGFDLHGKTAGVIGTGNIGEVMTQILNGFGMKLLGYDIVQNSKCKTLGMKYVSLEELLKNSDIVTLHCPLTPETRYFINQNTLAIMKPHALLINTSRGATVNTKAVIDALKNKKLGGFGLDVYEHEGDFFFKDLSDEIIPDDLISRLVTFPNVILTGHQGFFTKEALENIANTTLENIDLFLTNKPCKNIVDGISNC